MVTKKAAAKSDADVRAELLEFAGYEDDADPEMQETLRDSVVEHFNGLGDEDETYNELSAEAQAWWEKAVGMLNKDKPVHLLPDSPTEEVKPATAKKTAAKTNNVVVAKAGKVTAKKAGKAPPEKKEPVVSAADLIRYIVAKKPSITNEQIKVELDKKGVECGEASIAACASYSRRDRQVYEELGLIK